MAISDIPEFSEVAPGELIRAENWNSIQRQLRNGLRTHHHTRAPGAPANDAAVVDEATQIQTNEIADVAITSVKIAPNAIDSARIAPEAVILSRMAPNSVGTSQLMTNAVTAPKISFQTVEAGSLNLGPGGISETLVQAQAPSTKTTLYFPTLAIVDTTGAGVSSVEANIVYRQAVGVNTIDVYIRLHNRGAGTAAIMWQVLTFAS